MAQAFGRRARDVRIRYSGGVSMDTGLPYTDCTTITSRLPPSMAKAILIAWAIFACQMAKDRIPVVVLIHGGFWREIYTRDTLDSLAVDLVARGYATWNVEYRRVPPIGAWRTTISDVVDAIDAVHALAERVPIDAEKTIVLGHSAGAHLAVLAAARTAHPIASMVLLGGVLDLSLLPTEHDALPIFLGDELDTHRNAVDPCQNIPVDIAALVVHGTEDTSVDPTHSTNYVTAARSANAEVTHVSLDGSDHWDIIDASSPTWESIAEQF